MSTWYYMYRYMYINVSSLLNHFCQVAPVVGNWLRFISCLGRNLAIHMSADNRDVQKDHRGAVCVPGMCESSV